MSVEPAFRVGDLLYAPWHEGLGSGFIIVTCVDKWATQWTGFWIDEQLSVKYRITEADASDFTLISRAPSYL